MAEKQKKTDFSKEALQKNSNSLWYGIFDYLKIIIGASIIAADINMFLVPNELVAGGVTGLGILAHLVFHVPVGMVILGLNIPVLWLGWKYGGGSRFLIRTLIGIITLALMTDILGPYLTTPTKDPLLVILYGGVLEGIGVALVFRGRGTTGGADVIGWLANRHFDIGIGKTMLFVNGFVYALALWRLGPEPVMIAFARAFVAVKMLDTILYGFSATRAVFVISEKHEEVKDSILQHLRRGVTILQGSGGYTGAERPVLYVVVAKNEVIRLKRRIIAVDPDAFVSITPAQTIVGGFSLPGSPDRQ